jgi:hypothetical protein
MSDEYKTHGKCQISSQAFSDLAQQLSLSEEYEVLAANQQEVLLRFKGNGPKREKWPEDVTIRRSKEGISVVVHSGNRLFRQTLIDKLEGLMKNQGYNFDLRNSK